jgi:hypothetical protein
MKYFIPLLLGLLLFTACKKEPEKPLCASYFNETQCAIFEQRFYPEMTIPDTALAYYTATIEGKKTAVYEGPNKGGLTYSNGVKGAKFGFYRMPEWEGKIPGVLEFHFPQPSSFWNIPNNILYAESIFTPGLKEMDTDYLEPSGWKLTLRVHSDIKTTPITTSTVWPFSTVSHKGPSSFNKFEITKVERQDLGGKIRYHLWIDFQAEIFREASNLIPDIDLYFTRIENGKAKLYVDVDK